MYIGFIFCISAWYHKRKTPIVFQPDYISHEKLWALYWFFMWWLSTLLMWRNNSEFSWDIGFIFCIIYSLYHERKTPMICQPDCISHSEVNNFLWLSAGLSLTVSVLSLYTIVNLRNASLNLSHTMLKKLIVHVYDIICQCLFIYHNCSWAK